MFARSFERSMKIACERRRTALLMHPVVEDPLNTSVGICTIPGTGLTHPTPVLVGSLRASGATGIRCNRTSCYVEAGSGASEP
ncbi:hypothetical protein VTO73DRAFT_12731 [Trametes versicolor]